IKDGKASADARVAHALYTRALGYEYPDFHVGARGLVTSVMRHCPGDVAAQIFWLKNRQPRLWRDRREYAVKRVSLSAIARDIEHVIGGLIEQAPGNANSAAQSRGLFPLLESDKRRLLKRRSLGRG